MFLEATIIGSAGYLMMSSMKSMKKNKLRNAKKVQKALTLSTAPMTEKQKKQYSDAEKWEYFLRVKKAFEQAVGTPMEKAIEQDLIEAERAIQDRKKGFYFGASVELGLESGQSSIKPLFVKWGNLYNHYMIFGTTRFGKTRALANHMRQFINEGYNVFVIDPKGGEKHEILGWACEFANEAGRLDDLMFMNPVFPTITDCFNPIFNKENNEIASELKMYVQGNSKNSTDFFTLRVPQVINAIGTACEFIEKARDPDGEFIKREIEKEIKKYFIDRITNGHKVTVKKDLMIMNPDVAQRSSERISDLPKRTKGGAFLRKLMTYRDFAYYSEYENLNSLKLEVESLPIPEWVSPQQRSELELLKDEALSLMVGALGPSQEQYMKTTGSLIELLTKLSTGSVGRMFCSVSINPVQLRLESEEQGIIAVIQPNPLKYQSVSEMIMKIFLKMLESTFGAVAASGRLYNRRTIVIIDESSKAMFPGIEELFNKLGGLGLSFGLYTQSQADMKQMLGPETATVIMDNINTVGYMKTTDLESRRSASDDFGETRVIDYQMQVQGGIGGMGRAGVTAELQAIAHRDTFDELKIGECLIKHYGKKYFVKFPYQLPPSSYIIMPQLQSEKITQEMLAFQEMLSSKMFAEEKVEVEIKVEESPPLQL